VSYELEEAINYAESAELPVVAKTAIGASGSGIRVIRDRNELRRYTRMSFGRGIVPRGFDPRDRQRGYVYLQKYIPRVREWRMVRIGDSFFGYRKEPDSNGIHSASHKWSWLDPGERLLNFLQDVTDKGGFHSMDVDVFETEQGNLLVSELQTVFGCTTPAVQMKVNDVEGRYVRQDGKWIFQPGSFCANHMCNLRILWVLENVLKYVPNLSTIA
jgi:glutathione synthase/RimK-type ligase-like ATP-grasp enzyme